MSSVSFITSAFFVLMFFTLHRTTSTTDYCFTHGQSLNDRNFEYFLGHCKYGSGEYGDSIYYYNQELENFELNHKNSEFPEELGEI